MNRQRLGRPVALAATFLTLFASAGCASSASSSNGPATSIVTEIPSPSRQRLAPVTGQLLDGGQFDSRRLADMVLVYNVWGSWCAPCRKEAPVLRRVSKENYSRGVRFIGLDVRDNDASARAFERRLGITYPSIVSNDSARALLIFGPVLPVNAVPSTVIIDRHGKVAARVIGPTTYSTLSGLVEDVVSESRAQ